MKFVNGEILTAVLMNDWISCV